jgi:hypothetical protein
VLFAAVLFAASYNILFKVMSLLPLPLPLPLALPLPLYFSCFFVFTHHSFSNCAALMPNTYPYTPIHTLQHHPTPFKVGGRGRGATRP